MPNRTGEERSAMANDGGMDYYAILNVPRSSSSAEIRGAYRLMASAVHPDKHMMNHDVRYALAILIGIINNVRGADRRST